MEVVTGGRSRRRQADGHGGGSWRRRRTWRGGEARGGRNSRARGTPRGRTRWGGAGAQGRGRGGTWAGLVGREASLEGPGTGRPRFAPPPDPPPPRRLPPARVASSPRCASREGKLVVRGWLCEAAAPATIALNTKEPFSRPSCFPPGADGRHWLMDARTGSCQPHRFLWFLQKACFQSYRKV